MKPCIVTVALVASPGNQKPQVEREYQFDIADRCTTRCLVNVLQQLAGTPYSLQFLVGSRWSNVTKLEDLDAVYKEYKELYGHYGLRHKDESTYGVLITTEMFLQWATQA